MATMSANSAVFKLGGCSVGVLCWETCQPHLEFQFNHQNDNGKKIFQEIKGLCGNALIDAELLYLPIAELGEDRQRVFVSLMVPNSSPEMCAVRKAFEGIKSFVSRNSLNHEPSRTISYRVVEERSSAPTKSRQQTSRDSNCAIM